MHMMTPMKRKMVPSKTRMEPMPEMDDGGGTDSTVQDAFQGGGTIVLNVSDYPKLEGIEAGSPVTGQWEGTVDSAQDENGDIPVTFTKMEVEVENSADKALEELSNKPEQSGAVDEGDDDL